MVLLNDETLMAYVDGELDAATASEVEAALVDNPAARETVAMFRESARLAQDAFAAPMDQDVPAHLLAPFEDTAADPAPSAEVVDFAARRAARPAGPVQRFALPLAASIALAVGIAGGWTLSSQTVTPEDPGMLLGGISTESRLHAALESTPSGQALAWDGGAITPLLTFRDTDGRFCREFQSTGSAGGQGSIGIACRGDGQWQGQFAIAAQTSGQGDIVPASGGVESLETFVDELMADIPLDAEAEAAALAAGWK